MLRWLTLTALTLGFGQAKAYLAEKPSELAEPEIFKGQDGFGLDTFGMSLSQYGTGNETTELVERQQRKCDPGWTMCPDGVYCTKIGYFCCPNNNAVGCENGQTCCPMGGCAKVGFDCCPNVRGACPKGSSCCSAPSQSCQPIGGSCCGTGACKAGESCCNGQGCASAGSQCCGTGQCPKSSKCCVDEDGDYYCAASCVPSLIFPYVKGLLDEVYENMCRGVAAHRSTNDPQTAILTLDPKSGKDLRKNKATRRKAARCTGSGKIKCPKGWSCDEFPFASSIEGGSGAQVMCVPRWHNDWQGTYYNSWLSEQINSGKLSRGGKYRVKLKYIDCSQYTKREVTTRADSNPVLKSDGNVTILAESIFGNYSQGGNAMFIALTENENQPGQYTLDYKVSKGQLISGAIVDDEGETLANLTSTTSDSSSSVSVDLDDGYGDITFLGWTKDSDVNVDYSVKVSPSSPSTTPSSTTSLRAPTSPAPPPASGSNPPASSASLASANFLLLVAGAVLVSFLQI